MYGLFVRQDQLMQEISTRQAVQTTLDTFKEMDRRRLEELSTVGMQCEPDVVEIAIQTEFICPPVSLEILNYIYDSLRHNIGYKLSTFILFNNIFVRFCA